MDKFISMWKVRELADKVLVSPVNCSKHQIIKFQNVQVGVHCVRTSASALFVQLIFRLTISGISCPNSSSDVSFAEQMSS